MNRDFHAAYEDLRAREEAALAAKRPLVVIRGGVATLQHAGKELRRPLLDDRYHALKGLTHVAIAAVSRLVTIGPGRPTEAEAARLRELRGNIAAAERALPRAVTDPGLVAANCRLLAATTALLDEALAHGRPGEERVRAYGASIRAEVTANLAEASRLHLETLDRAARDMALAAGPQAWAEVVVVIATSHQARARELNVQYFERLLGERMGEGALGEQRLIVTEGPLERLSPGAFAAAHLLDQRLSRLLFDDPLFLQSDVTGRFIADHLDRLFPARGP